VIEYKTAQKISWMNIHFLFLYTFGTLKQKLLGIDKKFEHFIRHIPKAELHVHLEGTMEAEMMFKLAQRNQVKFRFSDVDELKKAYEFKNLRDFLFLYTEGTRVLRKSIDFYEIAMAYLEKIHGQNVLHTEIFIDFQTYLKRNIPPDVIMEGLNQAVKDAKTQWDMSVLLILCFLRQLGPEAAMQTFEHVLRFREQITGIGLASVEIGYPPELFRQVFDRAREEGFKLVAHAGEEGPWQYVQGSVDILKVDRIDHGNNSCQNPEFAERIADMRIPLTLCPLSNIKLKNVDRLENHSAKRMLDKGMLVTINSDDPSYFCGYVNENYIAIADALDLSRKDIITLAKNSFEAAFIPDSQKKGYIQQVNDFAKMHKN
jgi:adenine deaminase